MTKSSKPLPDTWSLVPVGSVLDVQYGKGLPARDRVDTGGFSVYGSNGVVGRHDEAITDGPALIIGRKGGAGEVHMASEPCWPIDTTYYGYPLPGISIRYLFHALRFLGLRSLDRSTAVPSLSRDDLNVQLVPIPPAAEQVRIVDEIETQFTRLDTAVADLRRLQQNLDRYRASVLKAAFEGRLVPQDPADEPAEQLLQRILAERRRRWEEQEWQKHVERAQKKVAQARRKAAGRPARLGDLAPDEWQAVPEPEYRVYLPKGEKWKEGYQQPERPKINDLPVLPPDWVWTSFDDLLFELRNGYFGGAPQQEPPGIRILRISAVRPMSVDLLDRKYLKEEFSPKLESYLLEAGDLLFTRYNGNLHFVGVCGLVPELTKPTIYPDKLIRARVPIDLVLPEYLELYFASAVPRRYIELKGKSTAGQQGISGSELKMAPVALPPLRVQRKIVEEVERCFSVVDGLEKALEVNLIRAQRLRQSILEKAFTGRLVSQDPEDEPAEELLERIRSSKNSDRKRVQPSLL